MSTSEQSVAVITGHRGFIGQHAVRALGADGWLVVAAGRPEVEIPSPAFSSLLRRSAPALVVHCAGPSSVQTAEESPEADRAGSVGVVEALVSVLEELNHTPRLLLVSSAAVYGDPPELPVSVDAPIRPISAYGRHRVDAEHTALTSSVPTTVARIFSAYGEGLERQVWWDIAQQALNGDVILSGDGSESRDFVHGDDIGCALTAIARRATFTGDVFNVATGTETTIAELADRLADRINPAVDVTFTGAARKGDPRRWRADIGALRSLGFEPTVGLSEGVERFARWVRET
jgi:UDP-glucose 4-epimerase